MIAEDFIDPTAEERALKDSRKAMPVFILRMLFLALDQAWINKGKKRPPQEMTDFLLHDLFHNKITSIKKKLQTISIVKGSFFFNKILKIKEMIRKQGQNYGSAFR